MSSSRVDSIVLVLLTTLRVEFKAKDRLIHLLDSQHDAVARLYSIYALASGIGSREVEHLGYILHPIKRPRAMKFRAALAMAFHHVRTRSVSAAWENEEIFSSKNCVSPRVLSFTPKKKKQFP
jgi:hypothetical protein